MAFSSHVAMGDPYEHVLNDLRQKRDELDVAIRAIEAVRGHAIVAPQKPVDQPQPKPLAGDFVGLSIAEAAKKVLATRDVPLHSNEIAKAIQACGVVMSSTDPTNTVNSVLNRRSHSVGDIVRVGRGFWGLKGQVGSRGLPSLQPDAKAASPVQEDAAS